MNALADAVKPLVASGPRLLAALSKIQDVSDREALAEAVGTALAEQASRVAAANAASGKENAAAAAAAAAAAPAAAVASAAAAPDPATRQLASLDDAAAIMRGVSFTQPWGSFDVAFFPGDKLVLRSAQRAGGKPASSSAAAAAAAPVRELVVPVSSVRAVAVLDAVPEEQAAFVLLGLKPALAVPWASAAAVASGNGATLDCLALRVPNSAPEESLSFAGSDGPPIRGNRAVALCAALGRAGVPPAAFLAPDAAVFSNAAAGGGGGGCSVRAAVKASQGHLFPLEDRAIAFVKKPAFLVSLRSLRAAELARVGTGSASFDLLLHLRAAPGGGGGGGEGGAEREGKVIEFGQIPRQELAPLRKWLEERGVPLGASAEEGAGGGKRKAAATAEEESDDDSDDDDEASSSDDEDDEDFDPKADAEELKAQDEAVKAEDEEEDGGEGEEEGEAGESSSDDDDRPAKKNKF